MARPLDLDELLEHFTLADDELELLRNKSSATRLAFGLLLKYLAWKGRFPRAVAARSLTTPSTTSPARSASRPRNWACTTGQDARASATGSRLAGTLGFGSAASPTPTS
jgi:hypothetical protein